MDEIKRSISISVYYGWKRSIKNGRRREIDRNIIFWLQISLSPHSGTNTKIKWDMCSCILNIILKYAVGTCLWLYWKLTLNTHFLLDFIYFHETIEFSLTSVTSSHVQIWKIFLIKLRKSESYTFHLWFVSFLGLFLPLSCLLLYKLNDPEKAMVVCPFVLVPRRFVGGDDSNGYCPCGCAAIPKIITFERKVRLKLGVVCMCICWISKWSLIKTIFRQFVPELCPFLYFVLCNC